MEIEGEFAVREPRNGRGAVGAKRRDRGMKGKRVGEQRQYHRSDKR